MHLEECALGSGQSDQCYCLNMIVALFDIVSVAPVQLFFYNIVMEVYK